MDRYGVIQRSIDKISGENYLEIGVLGGHLFFRIKAKRKVAVDPHFSLSRKMRLRYPLRSLNARYFEMTSDAFFSQIRLPFQFDVVFVDGLHTYQQVLRDVENSLSRLTQNGIIVMHDCNPISVSAAYPAASYEEVCSLNLPGFNDEWSGDVWKAVSFLRSQRKDLRVFVLDCDYGLGIVRRGMPESILEMSEASIEKLSYSDLEANRVEFLNLKAPNYFDEFLATL
jgi:hypothetical protein